MAPSPGNDMQQGAPRTAENMAWVPGGSFLMGSEDFYPEERPVRRVEVDGFWMDARPVTVADFRRFVMATGYVTVAERPLDPREYPGAEPARQGEAVDTSTAHLGFRCIVRDTTAASR